MDDKAIGLKAVLEKLQQTVFLSFFLSSSVTSLLPPPFYNSTNWCNQYYPLSPDGVFFQQLKRFLNWAVCGRVIVCSVSTLGRNCITRCWDASFDQVNQVKRGFPQNLKLFWRPPQPLGNTARISRANAQGMAPHVPNVQQRRFFQRTHIFLITLTN